jgi:hypothetical protein
VAPFVWMPLAEPSYKTRTLAGEESEPEDLDQVYRGIPIKRGRTPGLGAEGGLRYCWRPDFQ